jgi:hypothetical protein
MDTQHWIALAIAVLPVCGFGLKFLAGQKLITRNAARSHLVQLAQEIVGQTEATLRANPNADLASLLNAGVGELRSLADKEVIALGLPPEFVDSELMLLLQRYGSRLPGIAGKLAGTIANDWSSAAPGAPSVSGASGMVSMRRGLPFARAVGPVAR